MPPLIIFATGPTAECQRLLADMGVDPRVCIHAMDTPPSKIFYFTPQELDDLKLATRIEY